MMMKINRIIFKKVLYCVIAGALFALLLNMLPVHDIVHAEETEPRCWVLVVGVSKYPILDFNVKVIDENGDAVTDNDLKYSNADANEIYSSFCSVWGEDNGILLLNENATKTDIYYAIKQLKEKVSPTDRVLIYFSGHGIAPVEDGQLPGRLYAQRAGAGYLSPYGTRITHLNYEISAVELADWLEELESNHMVIMLDTCYSGSFSRELSQRGRVILMSSAHDEPSLECPEIGHGVFTNFILQAIDDFDNADTNHDYILSAEEVFSFAEPLTTDGITTCDEEPLPGTMKQHPVISDGYPGELSLFMKVDVHCSVPSASDTIVFNVDGNNYTSRLESTFTWIPGSMHSIEFPAIVENEDGERLVFVSWNDGTKSASRTITEGGDYTATYKKQYKLSINSMHGNPKGGGWYDDGTIATISVTSPDGKLILQRFNGWYGSIVASTKEINLVVDTAKYINVVWKADYFRIYMLAAFIAVLSSVAIVLFIIRIKKKHARSETVK